MKQDDSISLNKFIANTGQCSRREADQLIEQGRVTLNGNPAKKGNRVHPGDEVILDGQRLGKKPKSVYIMLNKPAGITCTTDLNDKDNIIKFIGHPHRIFPIGRLDKDSTGLILLTNDGNIVNQILREENKHEKEYIVTVNKPVTPDFVETMKSGVRILGKKTKKCEVERIGKFAFRIVLTQGMNRQIRRMCETQGYFVRSLARVRIMDLHLGKLPLGKWRKLNHHEKENLLAKLKG